MIDLISLLQYVAPIPNLAAQIATSKDNAYLANKIYCFGYVCMIGFNFTLPNFSWGNIGYFFILWICSIIGVIKYRKEYINKF